VVIIGAGPDRRIAARSAIGLGAKRVKISIMSIPNLEIFQAPLNAKQSIPLPFNLKLLKSFKNVVMSP